jgi:hypothetical protein
VPFAPANRHFLWMTCVNCVGKRGFFSSCLRIVKTDGVGRRPTLSLVYVCACLTAFCVCVVRGHPQVCTCKALEGGVRACGHMRSVLPTAYVPWIGIEPRQSTLDWLQQRSHWSAVWLFDRDSMGVRRCGMQGLWCPQQPPIWRAISRGRGVTRSMDSVGGHGHTGAG